MTHYARRPKLIELTGPELLTLGEAKMHLKVDHAHSDAEITAMVKEAREFAEDFTGLSLTARTLEIALDSFGDLAVIFLPGGPVAAIDEITVPGSAGPTPIADTLYTLDNYSTAARLCAVSSWPAVSAKTNAVKIRYSAGFASGGCPGAIMAAVKLVLSHLFENRNGVSQGAVDVMKAAEEIMRPHRVRFGMA